MDKYKAIFYMHGFTKEVDMSGTPGIDVGFSLPADTTTEKNKSLSIYFKLMSFDGEVANYHFYGSREMK